ncbi:MAG: hypothetical protein K6U78_17915, partial [Anaerolineae bacterium]|nr:hypothetical protein [Anaerolineae bacterium]
TGEIAGAEGEISFSAQPGERFRYVDGNANGQAVSLVFTQRAIEYKVGEPLGFHDIQMNAPNSDA